MRADGYIRGNIRTDDSHLNGSYIYWASGIFDELVRTGSMFSLMATKCQPPRAADIYTALIHASQINAVALSYIVGINLKSLLVFSPVRCATRVGTSLE